MNVILALLERRVHVALSTTCKTRLMLYLEGLCGSQKKDVCGEIITREAFSIFGAE